MVSLPTPVNADPSIAGCCEWMWGHSATTNNTGASPSQKLRRRGRSERVLATRAVGDTLHDSTLTVSAIADVFTRFGGVGTLLRTRVVPLRDHCSSWITIQGLVQHNWSLRVESFRSELLQRLIEVMERSLLSLRICPFRHPC